MTPGAVTLMKTKQNKQKKYFDEKIRMERSTVHYNYAEKLGKRDDSYIIKKYCT